MTELCILHANCQGQPLGRLLLASPDFRVRWHIRGVLNYRREPLTDEHLTQATLFLHQNLTAKWEVLASENVLKRLSPRAAAVCIPNPFFKGYWPFWTSLSSRSEGLRFGDIFLEYLLDMNLEIPEILHIYLNKPLDGKYDLNALLADSFAIEAEREAACAFRTLPFVRAHWREQQLFTTINHPGFELLRFMADQVLDCLDMPPLTDADLAACGCFAPDAVTCDAAPEDTLHLPIHPQVAAFFGLPFGGAKTLYRAFGRSITCAEYVAAYAHARRQGLDIQMYLRHLAVESA